MGDDVVMVEKSVKSHSMEMTSILRERERKKKKVIERVVEMHNMSGTMGMFNKKIGRWQQLLENLLQTTLSLNITDTTHHNDCFTWINGFQVFW